MGRTPVAVADRLSSTVAAVAESIAWISGGATRVNELGRQPQPLAALAILGMLATEGTMALVRQTIDSKAFNSTATLPFSLRLKDFEIAMQDVYDFYFDVNKLLLAKGLHRLDDMLRPAAMSGMISDMLTASMAKHARSLVENQHFNGHPDLIVQGRYANNAIASGTDGIEIKSTRKAGGAVDTHGARDQWMCVFVYLTDHTTEPALYRAPMRFTEVYLGNVTTADFRNNPRGALGTRTSTLSRTGIVKLRSNWIYKLL